MGFTKTIIQLYSDKYRFTLNDFVTGTLSLLQYGLDNNIAVKINLEDSYFSQYIISNNSNTYGYPVKVYSTDTDLEILYNDLEDFKTNTAPILIVATNWLIRSSRVSDFAVLEFKKLVQFSPLIYSLATNRVTTQLLNIHLPHTDPIISVLLPETHVCLRDPITCERPKPSPWLPTDYNVIYVDINERVCLNYLDTVRLSETIRSSLILDKNIMLISSNKILGNCLTEHLEVNYVSDLIVDIDDASGSLESLSWEPVDELVNIILLANAKKIYVFTEQSKPVTGGFLAATRISNVSVQNFKFFYSKVEISPMPVFR